MVVLFILSCVMLLLSIMAAFASTNTETTDGEITCLRFMCFSFVCFVGCGGAFIVSFVDLLISEGF